MTESFDPTNEHGEDALGKALVEIQRTLPPERYGWAKALEKGLHNPMYSESANSDYVIKGEMDIGKPPDIVAYDCLSGSIVARDILAKYDISSSVASAGLKETGFTFINDILLVLRDGLLLRIVPMYPLLSKPKRGEKYIKGSVNEQDENDVRNGKFTFALDEHGTYLPLSGFQKMGMYVSTAVACNYADDDYVHFVHFTHYGNGTRMVKHIYTMVSVPKNEKLDSLPTDLNVLLQHGVKVPFYQEASDFILGRLNTLKQFQINNPLDPNASVKASRSEGFRRDSTAIAGLAKSISVAFHNSH
jgi:hypothetical protein